MEKVFALHDVWCHAPCLHHTGKVLLCLCCHCHWWLCNFSTAWYCCRQKFWQVTAEMTWRCRSKRSKMRNHSCMEIIIVNQHPLTSFYILLPKNHKRISKARPKVLWPLLVQHIPMTSLVAHCDVPSQAPRCYRQSPHITLVLKDALQNLVVPGRKLSFNSGSCFRYSWLFYWCFLNDFQTFQSHLG